MGKFRAWIQDNGGTGSVARLLGKKQKAVQHWTTGRSHPKLKDAEKILKLAAGQLTLADILKARK